MKAQLFILFFLVLLTGIPSKEKVISKKVKASLIPVILKDNLMDYGLISELLQAKQSGILSDYQFSIWMGSNGLLTGMDDGLGIKFRKAISGSGAGFVGSSIGEWNELRSSDWSFYDNHAYTSDWELGLWELAK